MTVSRFPRLMLLTLVTVSCGGAADGSAAIVPVRSLSSVAIAWNGKPLAQGTTVQMNAVAKDNQGAELPTGVVTWTSSDPASASVSASGEVAAIGRSGSVTITATSGGKSGTASVPLWWVYRSGPQTAYKVGFSLISVRDTAHNRQIVLGVRLPVGASGPLPIVFDVFPSGGGYSLDSTWGNALARAGYAVLHVGSFSYDQPQLCASFQVQDCSALILPDRLSNARDVRIVMDNLASVGSRAGVVFDSAHVGVLGASAGGAVAMYLAGALVDLSPAVKGVSLADSRFAAFLTNSAPATATADGSPSGFSSTSWTSISKPAMQQTGSGDEPGRRVVYDVMRPGDKFLSFFDSPLVTHQSFFFLDLAPPEFAPLIVTNGMAFFDAYLRGSAEAKAWLTTNQLSRGTNGVAQISNK